VLVVGILINLASDAIVGEESSDPRDDSTSAELPVKERTPEPSVLPEIDDPEVHTEKPDDA
jgi:hypothetical protein